MTLAAIILAAGLAVFPSAVKDDPHGAPGKIACVECHERLPFAKGGPPRLRKEESGICQSCHRLHHVDNGLKSHPVNAVPSMPVPPDMILDHRGRIACVTCHAFHGSYMNKDGSKQFYLRRTPGKTFCFSCHRKLL